MEKTILIASDHAGFELKHKLISFLHDLGYKVKDFGADSFQVEDDYPDFIVPLARKISESGGMKTGIVIGGSGQGEAMVANRFRHVRAMVFNGQYRPVDMSTGENPEKDRRVPLEVKTAREHNDANVLSLGARFISEADAKEAVKNFLTTPFSEDERHMRRLKKIDDAEKIDAIDPR